MNMRGFTGHLAFAVCVAIFLGTLAGCERNPFSGSKLTLDNYNKITPGMSKGQVEQILGPPTTKETKSVVLYEKTTYRYEEGKNFAMLTFKNDELVSKDTNLGTR